MGLPIVSLSTASLWGVGIGRTVDLAAQAGCQGIELVFDPEVLVRGSAWVLKRARAAGIAITSVHPFLYALPGTLGRFCAPMELVKLAEAVGAPVVTVHPPAVRDRRAAHWTHWLRAMEAARELAADCGVSVSLENPPVFSTADRQKVLSRIDELAAFCEERDWAVTYDTSHAWSAGDEVVHGCRRVIGRLANVHLSDVKMPPGWLDRPFLDSIMKHHQLPGVGILPLEATLQALLTSGYRGPVTLELSPLALAWPHLERAQSRVAAAVAWVREQGQKASPLAGEPGG